MTKADLLDKIEALAWEAADAGFSSVGQALACLGACTAMNQEADAARLLFPLSQAAANQAAASLRAGPGSSQLPQ